MFKKNIQSFLILSIVLGGSFFCFSNNASAQIEKQVRTFDNKLQLVNELKILDQAFEGVMDFTTVDLGGDGISELAVSYGYQAFPEVKLFRADGSSINAWQPYPIGYEGRINLASGDFDADKKDEIVTAPGEGGGPQVRIFDGFGQTKFNKGFFVDDETNRAGVEIAVGDVNGDKKNEIVASFLKDGKNWIKFYSHLGDVVGTPFQIEVADAFEPMKVAVYDLDNDGKGEIILGSGMGNEPEVRIYNDAGISVGWFAVYQAGFRGGVDVSAAKFDGINYIVTAAGFSGGPHIRFFNQKGEPQLNNKFFAYDESFRGGVNVSLGHFNSSGVDTLVVMPQTVTEVDGLSSSGKTIKVDVSEQRLYAYDRGRLIKTFLISSGRKGFDTPYGKFSVYKKRALVRMSWFYSENNPNNYDLPNVPSVLFFKGPYTLHGAYWHHNWGHRMSHGCVNISNENAKWLYHWAPVGSTVLIQE
ncbi:MAG: ErfK/YbiS/YcfS/YnhG family protein [Parcubacteria group bacterium GW2011_GWC2_39_14]|nr:MAG: ErfK/YbiS/YcfS/YnhG family protein [Parcubacteria group bacterium GW2011_GWC2_39_14]KKR54467.1 MAG: ErfK/YbiS/YcfS/YnhG family protein [Parcubacteria group bacterium GW2011_GWA2_40_23]